MKKTGKEYLRLFLLIAACILFFFLLEHYTQVLRFIRRFISICNPILYGFVMAYLLNPIMELFNLLFTKIRKKDKATRGIKIVSLIFTYVVAISALTAVGWVIVPQVRESVDSLVNNSSTYVSNFSEWLRGLTDWVERIAGNGSVKDTLESFAPKVEEAISNMAGSLVPRLQDVMSFVRSLTTVLGSLLFGIFISIYMLFDKENLIARFKKVVYTFFRKKTADNVVLFFRETNETVGNFISGKILDSFIIGVLCYFIFLIFNIRFAGLFAVIAGITNIIPIFGPLIGGVINGILLLFVQPEKILPFIIIVIVIQQVDGNILGPKILGKATGLSGFWVMVALTIGGGFFGLWGMILAVPIFTVLYRFFGKLVNASLKDSDLPSDTAYYVDYPPHPEAPDEKSKKSRSLSLRAFIRRKKRKRKKNALKKQEAAKAAEETAEEVSAEEPAGETAPEGEKDNAEV